MFGQDWAIPFVMRNDFGAIGFGFKKIRTGFVLGKIGLITLKILLFLFFRSVPVFFLCYLFKERVRNK